MSSARRDKGRTFQGFPCGPVVKNVSAKAGDTGLIPASGRSHIRQGSKAHQLLKRLCLEPVLQTTREATTVRSSHTTTREWPPLSTTRESPHSDEDPAQPNKNKEKERNP